MEHGGLGQRKSLKDEDLCIFTCELCICTLAQRRPGKGRTQNQKSAEKLTWDGV